MREEDEQEASRADLRAISLALFAEALRPEPS